MKTNQLSFLFTLSGLAYGNAQELCPDEVSTLFVDPNYDMFNCQYIDHPDLCGDCQGEAGYAPNNLNLITCDYIEEQVCGYIRCCEPCWEKAQNFVQCSQVEPGWQSNDGIVEEGCVIDCSRFPFSNLGGSPMDNGADNAANNAEDNTASISEIPPSGDVMPSDEFIQECQRAIANANCMIEKCEFCGDDGYPSVESTSLNMPENFGNFYTCDQVEDFLCPEIRCCEECWELSEFWYQCNIVQGGKELGRVEASCSIDCSGYPAGIGSSGGNAIDENESPLGSAVAEASEDEDEGNIFSDLMDTLTGSSAHSTGAAIETMVYWLMAVALFY